MLRLDRLKVHSFTCFTGTKVQMLTPEARAAVFVATQKPVACYTGTKVQMLTPEALVDDSWRQARTKVQILTPEALQKYKF